ncbi:type II secretion system F family protein [Nitrosophilus alvini]|uniref:type II secretion system F family protein n=1 Tax=Nitrosophilus alvini TaxID=2714855 RepID=UPI00190ABDEC|nr:type II secretion system F family protein [Nitrosophilus alvini]
MIYLISKIDSLGKKSVVFEAAENIEKAIRKIEREGAVAVDIKELPSFLSPIEYFLNKKRVKTEEIIEILENLHLVIKSGMPIQDGLKDMAKEAENPDLKEILQEISYSVEEGKSLSHALEKYEKYFSHIIISLVRIGEQTGELEDTLKKGAEFLKRIDTLKKKAKQAMIYPSFALTAITAALLVWLMYVLPKIITVFEEMKIELPPITKAIMWVSDFLNNNFLYIAFAVLVTVLIVKSAIKKFPKIRRAFDAALLKIPVISQFIRYFNIAFFSEYIRLAIISGLPIFDALQSMQKNIKNSIFKEKIEEAIEKIKSGQSISNAFSQTDIYPPFTVRMIAVGEETGALDEQLKYISGYYYAKVDYMAENVSKFIEPVVIIFVGAFMAIIMLGLMGPVYDLISQVGQQG